MHAGQVSATALTPHARGDIIQMLANLEKWSLKIKRY